MILCQLRLEHVGRGSPGDAFWLGSGLLVPSGGMSDEERRDLVRCWMRSWTMSGDGDAPIFVECTLVDEFGEREHFFEVLEWKMRSSDEPHYVVVGPRRPRAA